MRRRLFTGEETSALDPDVPWAIAGWLIGWGLAAVALNSALATPLDWFGIDWPSAAAFIESRASISDRLEFVKFVLTLGLPTTFVTLLSVSLVALGPNADPGVVFGHRRYLSRGWSLLPVVGRMNPLWAALLGIAAVTAAAVGLGLTYALGVGPGRPFVLSLVLLGAGTLLEVALVVRCAFWAIRLRTSPHLIAELGALGVNAVEHATGAFRLSRPRAPIRTADEQPRALEQIELLNITDALEQVAIRAQQNRQSFSTRVALYELRTIYEHYQRAIVEDRFPPRWYEFLPEPTLEGPRLPVGDRLHTTVVPADPHEDWFARYALSVFGRALQAACSDRDLSTGSEACEHLLVLVRLAADASLRPEHAGFGSAAAERALGVYREALLATSASQARDLEGPIIDAVSAMVADDRRRWPSGPTMTPDDLAAFVRDLGVGCLDRDDVHLLRRVLEGLEPHASVRARRELVMRVLMTSAHAVALDRAASARPLVEWVARVDRRGSAAARTARRLASRAADGSISAEQRLEVGIIGMALLQADSQSPWPGPIRAAVIAAVRQVGLSAEVIAAVSGVGREMTTTEERWRAVF